MTSKNGKSQSRQELTSEEMQREIDLQEINKRISPIANEAEDLLQGASNMSELNPVNDTEETADPVPDSFVSLLDASYAANLGKSQAGVSKKKVKIPKGLEERVGDLSSSSAEKVGLVGGAPQKTSRRGSGGCAAEQDPQAKAASAHLEHLMSNSHNVVEGFDSYVARVVQAGMKLHDKGAANIWRDCEPVVKDLTSRHSYKVSKILVSIMPCSVGEFYNRVMGLADGATLGMSDNLKRVEESMGAMVDNLQVRCHEMGKSQQYHDTQMTSLTTQVGHASTAIAQSVKLIENLAVKMSDAFMRMPLQSKAPTVLSESIGSSVFQAPRQSRAAPPPVDNPMRLDTVAAFLEKQKESKSVQGGKITQIEGLPQAPPISLFMGKRIEFIAPIFAHPLIALSDANRDYPGWWKCLEKGGNKARAKQVILKIFPTPEDPMKWVYSPE
ncbi:hypothetical protein RP20_CCG006850 [Aedes albopictus]|nr:hypothetical protein RP20_CCG006850 [Aedes albopictus]